MGRTFWGGEGLEEGGEEQFATVCGVAPAGVREGREGRREGEQEMQVVDEYVVQ